MLRAAAVTRAPAPRPCGSCPYRRDVPSGVWHPDEYAKLPGYDADTPYQPSALFLCHQQTGRVCAGWAGCHDMPHSLAVRVAAGEGRLTGDELDAILGYRSPVELFDSGAEAAAHGLAAVACPDVPARKAINKLSRKRATS